MGYPFGSPLAISLHLFLKTLTLFKEAGFPVIFNKGKCFLISSFSKASRLSAKEYNTRQLFDDVVFYTV
tara:strand:+ start:2504 stop:2710 length:207 start_codon:yes stop_codon:yes gene_type:complete